jgi:hypothetical protein
MTTKTIQARHLSVAHQIVEGGDGKPRRALPLAELHITPRDVWVRIKTTTGFERRDYQPRERVRIKVAS